MRLVHLAALTALAAFPLGALACSNGDPVQTEAPCSVDGDCKSGVCIDIHDADAGCTAGKYCSDPCKASTECALGGEQGDCVTVGGRSVCVYPSWRSLHGCER
jgi:hypothetical protein